MRRILANSELHSVVSEKSDGIDCLFLERRSVS